MSRVTGIYQAAAAVSPVYKTTSVGTLISRTLQVFKFNFKAALTLMLIPAILAALEGVLASVPAALPSMTEPSFGQLVITFFSWLASRIVSLVAIYVTLLFSCPLIMIYYSTLTQNTPMPLQEAITRFKQHWGGFVLTSLATSIMLLVFGFIDIIALIIAIVILTGFITASGHMLTSFGTLSIPLMIMISVVLGALTAFAFLGISSFQMLVAVFPVLSLAAPPHTATPKQNVFARILYSQKLLFVNFPKAMLFGALFVIFWVCLLSVLNLPLTTWSAFEQYRANLGNSAAFGTLPLHVSLISNLFFSLTKVLTVPFMLCAATLFWYDCQVKKEGIDLRLWLDKLQQARTPQKQN